VKKWYVLQVMTGRELDICHELQRVEIDARAPKELRQIRRGGQWHDEERQLLPGYVFAGVEYEPAIYHRAMSVAGVIRWLGPTIGTPVAIDDAEALRWQLDNPAALRPSTVLFAADGWHVVDGPLKAFEADIVDMNLRQRRVTVVTTLGGTPQQIKFGFIPLGAPSNG
jgi:transcription antitermination factor NusG